ncbi:phosphopantetheine-binding protein [Streptomyces sp. SP17BM10]|uniref:phosphopantetheine-binding protein n=1 Tax=Streptomyces sp. SP17BM10 TaxID=3002530 RepID=UPI002E77704A|nr:phosphopantetheine-binding protein [Streptomyces sp. SP17BM10]MEE1782269.1 phosphopantetheine-binding protein [Streptomyces sp. SP17BM10]
MDNTDLRAKILELAIAAGDGSVSADELAGADYSLRDVGYSSLSYMRLIDSIENEVGVYLDPEAPIEHYESIDSVTALVVASGIGADA